jgi:hypothetical protein
LKKRKQLEYIFLISVFLFFFLVPKDTDLGWHLRYGKEIIENHRLIKNNEFTVFLPNYYWPNSYTGYQILLYSFYRWGGLAGLALLNSLLLTAIAYVLYLVLDKKLTATILSFLIFIPFSRPVLFLGIRSQVFSILWFLLSIYLIKNTQRYKSCLFFILLAIVWTNTHGGFPFLFLALACFSLENLAKRKYHRLLILLVALGFSLLASLVNPYGKNIWITIWQHIHGYDLSKSIAEWTPPPPTTRLILAFGTIGAVVFKLKRGLVKNLGIFLLLILFFFAAMKARRNLPFYALALIILLKKEIIDYSKPIKNFAYLGLALLFTLGAINSLITVKIISNRKTFCRSISFPYPCQIVDRIKKKKITGNFFRNYEWGGFLEWQLPESKFFVDGRMSAWPTGSPKDPYHYYLEIVQARPGWQQTLKKYHISYILTTRGTFLDLELRKKPQGWHLLFEDKTGALWKID